jgi:hypothetical protein
MSFPFGFCMQVYLCKEWKRHLAVNIFFSTPKTNGLHKNNALNRRQLDRLLIFSPSDF